MADPAVVGGIDPVSFKRLQKDLKALGPAVRREFNKEIKGIAGKILSDAKSNASWSSRIPGSLRLSVTTTRVGVKANRKKAPHARAFEGFNQFGARKNFFRHPVFDTRGGDTAAQRSTVPWVNQRRRPFLAPAVEKNQAAFYRQAKKAVTKAARTVGWTK